MDTLVKGIPCLSLSNEPARVDGNLGKRKRPPQAMPTTGANKARRSGNAKRARW